MIFLWLNRRLGSGGQPAIFHSQSSSYDSADNSLMVSLRGLGFSPGFEIPMGTVLSVAALSDSNRNLMATSVSMMSVGPSDTVQGCQSRLFYEPFSSFCRLYLWDREMML